MLVRIFRSIFLKLFRGTLTHDSVVLGVSPRGSLAVLKACQVYAALKGKNFVSPEDVKILCPYVLSHRIILKDNIRFRGVSNASVIEELLRTIEVPTEKWSNG